MFFVPEPFVMFLMKSVVFLNIVGVVSTPHFIERGEGSNLFDYLEVPPLNVVTITNV